MKAGWITTRQTKFTAYVTLYILIVIGVLGLLNWLANRHNKSIDTTSNKRFSLAPQTEKVVGELKQDVKITYFDRTSNFTQAKDLLERYDNLSTKLVVDYVDPDKKPQLARAAGIRREGTIVVEAGQRRQEANALTEEEITGALIRALKGGERLACFTTGSGEHQLEEQGRSGYSRLKALLEKNNYKTQTLSVLEKPEIPKECTVLVIGGPRNDLLPPVVASIKTYVEGGGRAAFYLDPPMQLGKDNIAVNQGLLDLLKSWGVTANKDLVIDLTGIGQIFGFSEAVPLVTKYASHPIVREMEGTATAFPVTRSLEGTASGNTTVEKLFESGEASFATTNLSSSEIRKGPNDKSGPLTLGLAGTYKTGKDNLQGRFVVVGSSQWVANSILGFNGNPDLAMNIMNWLSSDEDLISIRPKDPEDRRIQLSRTQMNLLFYIIVILLPLAAVAAGVGVWWRRR